MAQRLAPIVVPVCLGGIASVLFAAYSFATVSHTASMLLGVAALLAASTLASRYPVPIEGPNSGGVSLSFVFAASAIVLFGWDAGVLVAFAAPVLIQLTEHRPLDPDRLQRLRLRMRGGRRRRSSSASSPETGPTR